MIKFRKLLNKQAQRQESGITLLISVLILAVVSMISFSIGTLVLREIKASRRFVQSEPALVASEAGGESALFFRIRGLTNYDEECPSFDSGTIPGGYDFEVCSELYADPLYFSTSSTNIKSILLYNPYNESSQAAGYSSITITATSGTAVILTVTAYNLNDPTDAPVSTTVPVNGSPGTLSGLSTSKSYAVFLDPGGSSLTANGSVDGTASGGFNGIPTENPSIESTGENAGLRRKIQIRF